MTTTTPGTRRGAVVTLVAGVALVVAAVGAVLLDAPTWLRTTLVLLAALTTTIRVVRGGWRRSVVDRVLVAVGGLLVVLVLVGIVLGVSGIGLRADTWAVGLGALAIVALGVSVLTSGGEREPAPEPAPVADGAWGRAALRTSPWAVAAALVVVAALVVSVRSVDDNSTPPVQMSLVSLTGAQAVVEVSSGEATGPLELRTDPGDGSAVTYPLFSVPEGGTVRTTVVVPVQGKVVVTVSNPGQVQPLRTLVVSR